MEWSGSLNFLSGILLIPPMIRTIIIKEPQVEFSTNTQVESYSPASEGVYLNVHLSQEERKEDSNKAIAKSPDGGVVEIAFSNSRDKSPETINIVYQF